MTLFQNSNGKIYVILKQRGDYALLETSQNGHIQWIVAWLLGKTSWGQGYYFDNAVNAIKFFNKKTAQ